MKLTIATWSLPSLTLTECAAFSKALGVGALDVGLFGRPALNKAALLADPLAEAEKVRALGVDLPSYYHVFGATIPDRNLAMPGMGAAHERDLDRVLTFCDAAGIGSLFLLPGMVNPGQSRDDAARISADNIRALMAVGEGHKTVITVEPHVQSWCESPALALQLIERTGVKLTLDYAHFACLGYRQEEIDPLAPHAAHIHLRQARPGRLQTKFGQGTLNFAAQFGLLQAQGYTGALTLEAVHEAYMDLLHDDVLTEMIHYRDAYRTWKGEA
jgi:sugar phosphate isomerase/epimerase